MTYQRVIPRDLFNEANLLKCYGQLYLKTEGLPGVELQHSDYDFDIHQTVDGDLTITNISLIVYGRYYYFWRPLNSRHPWPLYTYLSIGERVAVFTDEGELSPEFLKLLKDEN